MRQNPDDLLRRIKMDEASADETQGRLKIFSGMPQALAKRTRCWMLHMMPLHRGFDVVVGYVEPHQRPATSALLEGLKAFLLPWCSIKG